MAKTAYDYAVLMYMLAYYGQLWQLDSMLEDGASPFARVTPRQASLAVLTQVLVMEAKKTQGDTTVYAALGKEWRDMYGTQLDEMTVKNPPGGRHWAAKS